MVKEVEMKTCRMKIKTILQYIQSVPHRGGRSCCDENDTFATVMSINLMHNLLPVQWY